MISNEKIIQKYLNRYAGPTQRVRRCTINAFVKRQKLGPHQKQEKFGFDKHIFDLCEDKQPFLDYLDWLNGLTLTEPTKKNKWNLLRGFLNWVNDYYSKQMNEYYREKYEIAQNIPLNMQISYPSSFEWGKIHARGNSNADVLLEIEEIEKINEYLYDNHYMHYLVARVLEETGARPKGIRKARVNVKNLEKRFIEVEGKRRWEIYYISQILVREIIEYIELRATKSEFLFLTPHGLPYESNVGLWNVFRTCLKHCNIKKRVSFKTFRKTLNSLRKKKMGCSNDDAKILLNHATDDVNMKSYTIYKYEEYLDLFDKYYPYNNL